MKLFTWLEKSFTNKLIAQSLFISFVSTILLASASLFTSYKIVEGQENLLRNKDLIIARNSLEGKLNLMLLELIDLSQEPGVVDGMTQNGDPEIYLQPIFRAARFREIDRHGLSLWSKSGEKLYSTRDDAWLVENHLMDSSSLGSSSKIKTQSNSKTAASAEIRKHGDNELLRITVDVISPNTRKVLGYLAVEIPLLDLLAYSSASQGDPREWILGAALGDIDSKQITLRVSPPLDQLNLTLDFKGPGNGATEALYMLLPSFLVLILMGLLASWLLSRWIGAGVAEPILSLARSAREVVKLGRVNLQIPKSLQSLPAFRSSDEVGQLLRDESSMLEILHSLQNDLEAQVKQRAEILNAIFDLSPDGYLEIDEFDNIGFINPTFIAMMGFSEIDFHELTWPILRDFLNAKLVAGERQFDSGFFVQRILRFTTPSIRTLMVSMRVTNANSRILYWRDLTSEVEIGEMKRAFFAKIAHEFRTPLTSILGFSQMLSQSPSVGEGQKESLEIIIRQANNLLSLVNDLLDLARIEGGQAISWPVSSYGLATLTRLVLADFKIPDDHRHIELFLDEHLPEINVNREQFRQVLVNLLSNAFKYSPHGSPIEVRTCQTLKFGDRWIGLKIKDFGVGMRPAEISQLGTPFYRANTQAGVSGSGLGISVVREIMARNGGTIEFTSQLGVGTTVSLWFPEGHKSPDC